MIQFADIATRLQVREMWKIVFEDAEEYIDLYFRYKYCDENTLLYMEDEKAVASLQMLDYQFTFCGAEIPIIYLSGVSTLPEYRKRGYTRQLLIRSFEEAVHRRVPLMLLVPQEEWLLGFYHRYGFSQTFDTGVLEVLPSLKVLIEKYPRDLSAAFTEFDGWFRQQDMTVQKSLDDFRAVVEEAVLDDFPEKRNLIGLARVIDAEKLLSLFAAQYEGKSFSIAVRDELIERNNGLFAIAGGEVKRGVSLSGSRGLDSTGVITVDVRELAQLLLGYHTSEKERFIAALFPEKQPQMHFMLE